MPGEEGKKVSGNHKGKKGKGSGGAPSKPFGGYQRTGSHPQSKLRGETKGASHTQASNTKVASHTQASETKGASNTQLVFLREVSKGASHTQVPVPTKDSKEASATQEQRNKADKKYSWSGC
jgi:hypothetical protein